MWSFQLYSKHYESHTTGPRIPPFPHDVFQWAWSQRGECSLFTQHPQGPLHGHSLLPTLLKVCRRWVRTIQYFRFAYRSQYRSKRCWRNGQPQEKSWRYHSHQLLRSVLGRKYQELRPFLEVERFEVKWVKDFQKTSTSITFADGRYGGRCTEYGDYLQKFLMVSSFLLDSWYFMVRIHRWQAICQLLYMLACVRCTCNQLWLNIKIRTHWDSILLAIQNRFQIV